MCAAQLWSSVVIGQAMLSPDTFPGPGVLQGGPVGYKIFENMNYDLWIEAVWHGAL